MDKQQLQIGEGHERRAKHRGLLTATEVLERYKDLPAFCAERLTDVNQVGLFGEHPLGVAASRGDLAEIYALLDGGADVNGIGEHGNSPLHEATGQGHIDAVMLLLEFGANTDIRNEFGQTALDIASPEKQEDIAGILRKQKR